MKQVGERVDYRDVRNLIRDAKAYTKKFARTFYFASFILPQSKKQAAYVIYAFCRRADNILDETESRTVSDKLGDLESLRQELENVYGGDLAAGHEFSAFQETVRHYGIPREFISAILDGVAMDLEIKRYETWADLEVYCYRVASAVGLIMSRILGVSSDRAYPHAIQLGKAMQLTNILRDIREDYEMGRVYIPQKELEHFGCDESSLSGPAVSKEFADLMRFQISRARSLYRSAGGGIPFLISDGSRFCVEVMSALYERILDVIERRHYDVFRRRTVVSFPEKVMRVIRLAWSGNGNHS